MCFPWLRCWAGHVWEEDHDEWGCAHVAQHLQLESHRIRECNYFDAHDTGGTIDGALWRHSSIALWSLWPLLCLHCWSRWRRAVEVRRAKGSKKWKVWFFEIDAFLPPARGVFHPPAVRPSFQFLLLSFSSLSSLLSRSFCIENCIVQTMTDVVALLPTIASHHIDLQQPTSKKSSSIRSRCQCHRKVYLTNISRKICTYNILNHQL